jgi:Icc protein
VSTQISRREQLKRLGLGAVAGMSIGTWAARGANAPAAPRRVLRIAHITDIHVQPELGAGEGFAQCMQHIRAQSDPADLMINTGDCVMDCMAHDLDRTTVVWDLWQNTLSQGWTLPIHHVLGNHDVWGWSKKASNSTGNESGWGKATALQRLGMKGPYYSFDQAGWHFVALDTVQPFEDGYKAGIDDAQFRWLQDDLKSTDSKMPVLIYSHIPILSAAAILKEGIATKDNFTIPGGKMVLNNMEMKDLLKQHPKVKLCISGHIHLRDQITYMGVNYLCNGAVCGDYWKGNSKGECDPGYTMINLFEDGSFSYEYVSFGWRFRAV